MQTRENAENVVFNVTEVSSQVIRYGVQRQKAKEKSKNNQKSKPKI